MKNQIIILALLNLTMISCNQTALESKWTDQEIVVDGKLTEWQDHLIVPKNSHVGIGFMNDEHYLYLTLTTLDRNTIMQVLTRGFTVWIDPKGGNKHHLGFTYPINRNMGDFPQIMQNREQNSQDYDFFIHGLLAGQNEIEIIVPGKKKFARMGIHNSTGLHVKPMYKDGEFTYEMKIPLKRSVKNMVAINAKPGKNIGVGFTTPKLDRPSMENNRRSHPRGGMSVGRRGGGMSGGGMNRNMPVALEIWMKVTLSDGKIR